MCPRICSQSVYRRRGHGRKTDAGGRVRASFTIDRIDARLQSGETIVYQASGVSLTFVE